MTFTREQLLAEGVIEIGAIGSLLFVRTNAAIRITHATWLPKRELDSYAIKMIAHRLEQGEPLANMVADFSVNTPVLSNALRANGYDPADLAWNGLSKRSLERDRRERVHAGASS